MLAKLKMYIESDDFEISYHITSLLHGVLMSCIDSEYADVLHSNNLNPFSISLEKEQNNWCWTISTVGREAYDKIISVFNHNDYNSFVLTYKNNAVVNIIKKQLSIEYSSEIIKESLDIYNEKSVRVRFISPTAFKSNGEYIFYPDLYLIFRSLMKKSQLISNDMSFDDRDTLDNLVDNSRIVSYNLRTAKFNLEGKKITGFVGTITICFSGPAMMIGFAKMLFKIGSYLGVGIKASLGMGNLELIDKDGVKNE